MSDSPVPTDNPVYKLYRYTPNIAAAVIFLIAFAATMLYHVYQMIRNRSWYFTPLVIGGTFEVVGYIFRIMAHSNKESIPIYSITTILILLAPALFAASIYMVLGRLIVALDAEDLSPIRKKWMTKVFVIGDVIAFLSQAAGGGIMASGTASALATGEHITIAGLAIQLAFFSVFIFTATIFHRRFQRTANTAPMRMSVQYMMKNKNWEALLYVLYITSALILIRSAFRLIEYAGGNDGYLLSHEAFAYIFDATLMLFVMVILNIFHPSDVMGDKATLHGSTGMSLRSRGSGY
ncbi:putative rta1 like protein [Botrytis fragariae]|uniref:Putative rta1 like protein n=1 Tax=Botrytis fragariae TaxID=1964551 RepID=A0A8H6AJT3_9HELO|nr:putative rta1 like protein [Botrytis fragariae]KAF5868707.1 putative rta1 like protein [Botrytis fragariae]